MAVLYLCLFISKMIRSKYRNILAFLSYRKVLGENFLYDKKRSARMSTRTIGKYQLKLIVLGSQSGASPSR